MQKEEYVDFITHYGFFFNQITPLHLSKRFVTIVTTWNGFQKQILIWIL